MFITTDGSPQVSEEVMKVLEYYYKIVSEKEGWSIYPIHIKKSILISTLTLQEVLERGIWDKEITLEAIRFLDSDDLIGMGPAYPEYEKSELKEIGDYLLIDEEALPNDFQFEREDIWELDDIYIELERTLDGWSYYPYEGKKALIIQRLMEKASWANRRQDRQKELVELFLYTDVIKDIAPFVYLK